MKFFIFPYTQNSKGAIEIAAELEGKRILREGSSFSPKPTDLIINWGASDCPFKEALNYNNRAVVDKLKFFERLEGTGFTPPYATSKSAAQTLGYPVFCRTKTKSRDGAGIVVADNGQLLVNAPLYVKGIDKTHEFRIHVGRLPDGTVEIIGGQKKIKKAVTPEMTNIPEDSRVWCGDTCGLVWTVSGQPVYLPPRVVQCVVDAFGMFPELTFGGFDVVYDQPNDKAYVIEINSAPMVTPETRRLYGKFFRRYAEGLANLPKDLEGHSLGEIATAVSQTVPKSVAAEVAPAAPVPQAIKEATVPLPTPAPTFKATEVLDAFVTGKLSIKDLAEGYVKGQAVASEKEELVNTLQQLIIRVQG